MKTLSLICALAVSLAGSVLGKKEADGVASMAEVPPNAGASVHANGPEATGKSADAASTQQKQSMDDPFEGFSMESLDLLGKMFGMDDNKIAEVRARASDLIADKVPISDARWDDLFKDVLPDLNLDNMLKWDA